MRKDGGEVLLATATEEITPEATVAQTRPKDCAASIKLISDRRREISKAKDALHIAERQAERCADTHGRQEAASRWDAIHLSRDLVSSKADGFFQPAGGICHAQKSRMLKYPLSGNRLSSYTMNSCLTASEEDKRISSDLLDISIDSYYSLQMDVMNALHYRGNDGGRGTRLIDVVTGKMKRILLRWITGDKASSLKQLHLHVDDPTIVIAQKRSEQSRRDTIRSKTIIDEMDSRDSNHALPDYTDELVIPWSHLIQNRTYKDELSSLHMICAAVAAEELCMECDSSLEVYLHGGFFALHREFTGMKARSLSFRRFCGSDPEHFRGRVFIQPSKTQPGDDSNQKFIALPRGIVLILNTTTGLRLGEHQINHGEAETRFVAAFEAYVKPDLNRQSDTVAQLDHINHAASDEVLQVPFFKHGCLILSDDTDVFIILLLAEVMRGFKVLHVLNDSVHDLDAAFELTTAASVDPVTVATIYTFDGCDFLPGTFGLTHDAYLKAYLTHADKNLKSLTSSPHQNIMKQRCA